MSDKPTVSHPQDFAEVLVHIQKTRQRVFAQANTALMALYWQVGAIISQRVARAGWGKGVVSELARYIDQADPSIKGFSDKNLWRMKQFYETYGDDEELATVWRALSWSHHRLVMPLKSPEARAFYLQLAVSEKLSVRELERQIDAAQFERSRMPVKRDLPEPQSKSDLQRGLVQQMKALQWPDKKLIAARMHALLALHEGLGDE